MELESYDQSATYICHTPINFEVHSVGMHFNLNIIEGNVFWVVRYTTSLQIRITRRQDDVSRVIKTSYFTEGNLHMSHTLLVAINSTYPL